MSFFGKNSYLYSSGSHSGRSGSFAPTLGSVLSQGASFLGNQIKEMNNAKASLVDKSSEFIGTQLKDMQNGKAALVDRVYGTNFGSIYPDAISGSSAKSVSKAPIVSSGAVVSSGDGGVSVAAPDYLYADLAKVYGMDATTAYQEALSNTSYRRAMADLKAAGINPILAVNSLSGASGVSYARPLAEPSTVATVYEPSGGFSTGTTSGKSVHSWYKRLTNIGTIVGAAFGHPIIGSSVGSAIGNLIDLASNKD